MHAMTAHPIQMHQGTKFLCGTLHMPNSTTHDGTLGDRKWQSLNHRTPHVVGPHFATMRRRRRRRFSARKITLFQVGAGGNKPAEGLAKESKLQDRVEIVRRGRTVLGKTSRGSKVPSLSRSGRHTLAGRSPGDDVSRLAA